MKTQPTNDDFLSKVQYYCSLCESPKLNGFKCVNQHQPVNVMVICSDSTCTVGHCDYESFKWKHMNCRNGGFILTEDQKSKLYPELSMKTEMVSMNPSQNDIQVEVINVNKLDEEKVKVLKRKRDDESDEDVMKEIKKRKKENSTEEDLLRKEWQAKIQNMTPIDIINCFVELSQNIESKERETQILKGNLDLLNEMPISDLSFLETQQEHALTKKIKEYRVKKELSGDDLPELNGHENRCIIM